MKTKFLLIAMAATMVVSCGKKDKEAEAAPVEEALTEVKLATVSSEDIPQTDTYTATVESDVKNNISPNAPLRIEKIYVEVGDMVRKGQTLVQLDGSNLRQMKLNIDNQKVELSRIEQLYLAGGVSKADFDNMKTQIDVLEQQYSQLAQNTVLTAPISGVVTARNYDNGDMYGGMPVLTIEQTNPVKVLVNVSEEHYKDIKVGHAATITLDAYEGEEFPGKVSIVHPTVDAATHTFPVEITINNSAQKVRPGMFARTTVSYGSQNHVLIPDEALVKQIGAGDRYVYVYHADTQTVSYNKVELGKHLGDKYEIFSGVEPNDKVVVAGQARLTNGKKVKVVE